MTELRDCQDGKRTEFKKAVDVLFGMGARVREEGRDGLRTDVEEGSKGCVLDGVSRALRFVEMLSSILARERRRKSRSTRVLKQNWGVSCDGVVVGLDIMRGFMVERVGGVPEVRGGLGRSTGTGGDGVREGDVGGGDVQNHASLMVVDEARDNSRSGGRQIRDILGERSCEAS